MPVEEAHGPARPATVYISSAREDEPLRAELMKHLVLLERAGAVRILDDIPHRGGEMWANRLAETLDAADIILLLVSVASLVSEYNAQVVEHALRRQEEKGTLVVPVILRPCARLE